MRGCPPPQPHRGRYMFYWLNGTTPTELAQRDPGHSRLAHRPINQISWHPPGEAGPSSAKTRGFELVKLYLAAGYLALLDILFMFSNNFQAHSSSLSIRY